MAAKDAKEILSVISHECLDKTGLSRKAFVLEISAGQLRQTTPSLYISGILLDEATCEIYKPGAERDTPVKFSYYTPSDLYLPPHSLIQLMGLQWMGTCLVADTVLYFTPRDDYTRMGTYGERSSIWTWLAPDPAILCKRSEKGWPCIGAFCRSGREDPPRKTQTLPAKPLPPTAPPPAIPTDAAPSPREGADGDTTPKDPVLRHFTGFLRDHACEADGERVGPGELTAGTSRDTLRTLYEENRSFYSHEVQMELDRVLKSAPMLGEKPLRRARNLLRYAYRRAKTFTPIPEEPLRAALKQALPGQDTVIGCVMSAVHVSNRTRKPLTLLLLDEEEITAREIIRCLYSTMPGAEYLDGSLGALNLVGVEISYEGAAIGQTVSKLDGPLLCIDKLDAVYWRAQDNKDSAAPQFNALFSGRTFCDRFLGVPVRYYGHIVAQAADLELKYRSQFARIVEIPADTHEEKICRLQEKARGTRPAFVLDKEVAEKILKEYAPGSMSRALQFLELLRLFAADLGRPVCPKDLPAALGEPALTRDEQLVADLEGCAGDLPQETEREAAYQARVLLSTHIDEGEKQPARRILRTLVDYQNASRGMVPPPGPQLRRGLDAELLGLEEEKELVVQTLYAHRRRILFFVGAPGTGKTALARALAKASGRALVRIDMAALRPEQLTGLAPIMGQGGQESVLVRRIARAGCPAVILLDEIDKARPEVMECLLELFENQRILSDGLIGRVDLSSHLIVLSGNSLKISRPLLDRCRVITMRPYTPAEKEAILRRKWQDALEAEGLAFRPLGEELVHCVVRRCDTGGVRDIENMAERLARQICAGKPLPCTGQELDCLLGSCLPALPVIREPGNVYCLAALENGGGVVNPLLVRENPAPGAPCLQMLGMQGKSIQESARMALAWCACWLQKALPPLIMAMDASDKDGPSGGLAMALACYSLRSGRILEGVAATGELMLDGTVLAVGGVPSKLIGAMRCTPTVHTLFLPAANRMDIPPRLMGEVEEAGLQLHFVDTVQQAIEYLEKNRNPDDPKNNNTSLSWV